LREEAVTGAEAVEGVARGNATILVAEDDVILRTVVAEQFREEGYSVLETSNAEEVLLVLRTGIPVDLLFTDVRMPGTLDGIALARLVRAEFPYVKVMIASGNVAATEVGTTIHGFISKPYHIHQLLEHIKSLLPEEP
jgi:two-component system, response regulator PdtaR